MQFARLETMPERAGYNMPQRICEIVGHYLWLAGSPGSKIHKHYIFVGVHMLRTSERRCGGDAFIEVEPAIRDTRTGGNKMLHAHA